MAWGLGDHRGFVVKNDVCQKDGRQKGFGDSLHRHIRALLFEFGDAIGGEAVAGLG